MREVCARRGALLLRLLDTYAVRYSEMLDGRSEHLPVSELAGGARIRHIFLDIFVNGLQELNPSRRALTHSPSAYAAATHRACHGVGGCCLPQGPPPCITLLP